MPEVGLELHSGPCKYWESAKRCGIRSSSRAVRPDTRPRLWTMSTPRFPPVEAFNLRPHPAVTGCGSSLSCQICLGPQPRLCRIRIRQRTHLCRCSARRATIAADVLNRPYLGRSCRLVPWNRWTGRSFIAACHSDICPMIAGLVLRATRALPRRPRNENFPGWSGALRDEVFVPAPVPQVALRPLSPAGGPLPGRLTQPTTNRKSRQHKGEGNQRDHGKAHDHNTIGCPQLHRPHPGFLAPGEPGLHHLE